MANAYAIREGQVEPDHTYRVRDSVLVRPPETRELTVHVFSSSEERVKWLMRHRDAAYAVSAEDAAGVLLEGRTARHAYYRIKLHRGVEADPLAKQCLEVPVRPVPSIMRLVIAQLQFRYARTMPELPHEYTLRKDAATDEADEAYVALYEAIMKCGVVELWRGVPARYLYPGDGWRYWSMSAKRSDAHARHPLWVSHHINRNRA